MLIFCLASQQLPDHMGYCSSGESSSVAYLWEEMSSQTQQLAAAAGNCSVVQSYGVAFNSNFATIAGGAAYATDLQSLNLHCVDGHMASAIEPCNAWSNNTVQAQTSATADGTVLLQVFIHSLLF